MSKILIIDDDKDVLFAAEQYLQKNNEDVFSHRRFTGSSGAETGNDRLYRSGCAS